MKRSAYQIVIFLFFICFLPLLLAQPYSPPQADLPQQEVVSRGMGAIIAGDLAKAEDDAISNALRSAVEQVIGTMVESEVLVRNYQTIEDKIYSYTKGFVEQYQVVSKSQRGETIMEVTIRAVVKKGNLKENLEALGLLISRKGKPRLMIIVDEKNMDTHHYWGWTIDMNTSENEVMNVLLDKGFPFVDRETVMKKIQKDMVMAALEGDAVAAQSIGTQAGAEVLLIGKAVSKAASGGPAVLSQAGMVSCQATLNLRALRADDGTILATTSQQAATAHIDHLTGGTMSLQKAAQGAADDISSKIVDRWQKDVYAGTTINLRLLNVETFSDLVKVKNMLPSYIRGVLNVYQRDYSQNTAQFEIEVKGNATSVAEEMALKDFSPYQIEVINVTQNTIVAKLGKLIE
jgi:hypothetical protein